MDQLTEERLYNLKIIARSLFWLNLPPVAMVLTVSVLAITNHEFDSPEFYYFLPLIWLDAVLQVIYFMQFKRGSWLASKPVWITSVLLHSLFILLVVFIDIWTESYLFVIFLLYPLQLLLKSVGGLRLLKG